MRKISLAILCCSLLTSGCAQKPVPVMIGDKYYLAGDNLCVKYKILPDDSISCLSKWDKVTGSRYAMTDRQVSDYIKKRQIMTRNIKNRMHMSDLELQIYNQQPWPQWQ
ncbi:Hypothetical protein GOX1850 [Gluconobacter oxydans 621H]|uniref:Lipoprotein n=1 Tax=Gluconobacter oxydans (strain 621H) TaxID=290633 RepID=Q5FPV8_GLUOX|nr:Hypothetical protein GOX1850 [Gluconobacter oxydans 621H]TCW27337.1 hypothetical protein EDC20_10784 [Gluconobacter oxydans]